MDLFDPIVEVARQHKNFSSVLAPSRTTERALFAEWASGFVDRDGKLIEEFQTTFNSSFWEIYLHAVFKEYGFAIDWSHASPDFCLSCNGFEFIVEATTANSALGKPSEWDRTFSEDELRALRRFKALNTEAIIRISNALMGKSQKFETSYRKLEHVQRKPFVVAVAPFEQPHFNLQYDRPIRAILYDYYVDEDAFLGNPKAYPNGPPGIALGHVTKENGARIALGLFSAPEMTEISAVIFSCTATWGKLSAMSNNPNTKAVVRSIWATPPNGTPEVRLRDRDKHAENIRDGLQVYHNPFADHPLPAEILRAPRVVQHYVDADTGEWVYEGRTDALLFRQVLSMVIRA